MATDLLVFTSSSRNSKSFACSCQKYSFQLPLKLILKHKNAPLQLKKQNITKVKTFSRTEMYSLEVRRRTVCSTALFLSRSYLNVETTFQMNLIEEIWQLFILFFSVYFRYSTRHAQHVGKINVDILNFNLKLAKLVGMLNIFTIYLFVFLYLKRTLFWTIL